jgi:hypothetical protein
MLNFQGEKSKGKKCDFEVFEERVFGLLESVYFDKLKKGVVMADNELDMVEQRLNEISKILPLKNLEEENSKMELFYKHIDRLEKQYSNLLESSPVKLIPFENNDKK